jgi:P pilus assembly chaperone PapD
MTTRQAASYVILFVLLVVAMTTPARAQNVPRLIADNRTPYVVELYTRNGATWNFVSRIAPSSWQQFPNASNGSVWRAVFASNVSEHTVKYAWASDYGGDQDVWLIY